MSGLNGALQRTIGTFTLDLQFSLPAQGVTALFGHSGSGKSTLLRAIAGFERCQGRLQFGDTVWQNDATKHFLPTEQRPIGYVFQEASLFPHLDVAANLAFGYRRIAAAQRRISMTQAIDWLGLESLLSRRPATLSGGERQRVAIARALLVSPQLMLMDEPLSALDAPGKAAILPYLEQLHRELSIPIIYVTHAIDEVARLADYLLQLEHGRIIAEGAALQQLSRLHQVPVAGEEPGAVIEAVIKAHDEAHVLTRLALGSGIELLAPMLAAPVSTPVRIRIPAREVSLCLQPPQGTSILNILPATIIDHGEGDPGRLLVQLRLSSGQCLLSRITRHSWQTLNLHNGKPLYAQIKSMGLAG